jgi:succinate dehydrogenase/fumarate reductase flavoprotein subunit
VVPTVHYQMGGIPTNYHGEVVAPKSGQPGAIGAWLLRAGECAVRIGARRQPAGHQLAHRPAACSARRAANA